MIVYDLRCAQDHAFEGWFDSGAEFLRQQQAMLVRCPVCDDAEIVRLPTAKVKVRKEGAKPRRSERGNPAPTPAGAAASGAAPEAIAGLPADLVAALRQIVRSTEDVGERFPEEARRIHYDETPARAIRGQASREEADALAEEGIDFASLPPYLTRDTH